MQVWKVLHATRWKYRTQKNCQKFAISAPSHKFVGLYLRNWGTYRPRKKLVQQQYLLHMSPHYGELRSTSGWDRSVWGTPANFNGFRVLASLLQRRRSTEANQTLHDVWPSPGLLRYYIHFRRLLLPDGNLSRAKFTLRLSLAFSYIGSVTARHSSSRRQPNFAAYGWAQGATYIWQGDHHVGHWPTF